jgi:hypothetical protein
MIIKEKFENQIKIASNNKIDKIANKLRLQWNYKKRCLHTNYSSLLQSIGLSEADKPFLIEWIDKNGLLHPCKLTLKNKGVQ